MIYVIIYYMATFRRYFNNQQMFVFITFVTHNRREILVPNIDLFKESLIYAKTKYLFGIFAIAVMKNHCHLIICTKKSAEIPQIIKSIKYYFSSHISDEYVCNDISESAKKRNEKGIWQRRYYDHIIRDEEDLHKHIDYIHYNPTKHYNIAPKDWKFSSFNKFVQNGYYEKDWCNFKNEYNIDELDYE